MNVKTGIIIAGLIVAACGSETSGDAMQGDAPAEGSATPATMDGAAAPDAASLDDLLMFSDPESCARGTALGALDESFWARSDDPLAEVEVGDIVIPAEYRSAVGEPEVEQLDDGSKLLHLPVSGTWLGLPVSEIASWHVGYNWDMSIILDVAPAEAEPVLRAAGFPVEAGESVDGPYEADSGYVPVYGLHEAFGDPNRASFSCDFEDRG